MTFLKNPKTQIKPNPRTEEAVCRLARPEALPVRFLVRAAVAARDAAVRRMLAAVVVLEVLWSAKRMTTTMRMKTKMRKLKNMKSIATIK